MPTGAQPCRTASVHPEPLSARTLTVLPPRHPIGEKLIAYTQNSAHRQSATLQSPDGRRVVLPAEAFDALKIAVEAMSQDKAVTVTCVETVLPLRQAADFLGVIRSTLVTLADAAGIGFEQSERHRNIRLGDVISLGRQISRRRRTAIAKIAEVAEDSGAHHKTASPVRTR